MITLVDQKRTGLFAEHDGFAPITHDVRATIPAVEALRASGAKIEPLQLPVVGYRITLGKTIPAGIVAVHVNRSPYIGLRMTDEPEYPDEFPDFWAQVDWTPCPKCGAPLAWYEAGYVPGYRVCVARPNHHFIASTHAERTTDL